MTTENKISRRAVVAGSGLAAGALMAGPAKAASGPVAQTNSGKVRGRVENGTVVFRGIRYGADTATTRFAAPKRPEPWRGIKDAVAYGPTAPQAPDPPPPAGRPLQQRPAATALPPVSEDCLFLNVWTPALDKKKRPVLVWMHGGAFSVGVASAPLYDGGRLSRRGDVVVVSMNHRLGMLAHLYLAEIGGPAFADSGNAGILDLILSLQWVRDNIAAFGGDPDNVTIFGESGGGAKVSTLMGVPAAKGLFHKAIAQSGVMLVGTPPAEASAFAKALVASLGLTADRIEEIRALPREKLEDAANAAIKATGREFLDAVVFWRPVVDGKTLPRDPFTPDAPAWSKDVAHLVGMNRTEATNLVGAYDPITFELTWELLPGKLAPRLPGIDIDLVIETYRRLHPAFSPSDIFFAASTDSRWMRGHVMQAERKAAQKGAPVYKYMLTWTTPLDGARWGTPHGLDVGLVFDNVSPAMAATGPNPQKMADLMSEAWLAFARTGNPNHPGLPHWPPYDQKDRATMLFDLPPRVENNPHGEERALFANMRITSLG